jgi:hypothetical protein
MTANATYFAARHGFGILGRPSKTCGNGSGLPGKPSRGTMKLKSAAIWGIRGTDHAILGMIAETMIEAAEN